MKIGIGITTCERPELLAKTLKQVKLLSPKAKIFVNDDTEKREGVAKAKNNCLAALEDCDYIFLLDDDCYPVKKGWEQLFIDKAIETKNNHFCLIYPTDTNKYLKTVDGVEYFSHPGGTVLFMTNYAVRVVGGMDCNYKQWGCEHTGYSMRIHNAGLTKHPFMSIEGAMEYFHCLDFKEEVKSTVTDAEKKKLCFINSPLLKKEYQDGSFKPYKKDNYVCSIYLLGAKHSTYGNFTQKKNIELLRAWAVSLEKNNLTGILFHNCFTRNEQDLFYGLPVKFIRVQPPSKFQSGLYRYELYHKFMQHYAAYIENIFFSDSTDVEVLKNPVIQKEYQQDKIYIGCEPVKTGNKWMIEAARGYSKYSNWLAESPDHRVKVLLNAGLCGGSLKAIAHFIERMSQECISMYPVAEYQDMPIINLLAYTEFKQEIVFGDIVNTVFKGYEKNNKKAWFKHK